MAAVSSTRRAARRSGLLRSCMLAVGATLGCAVLAYHQAPTFVAGAPSGAALRGGRVTLYAESPAPAPAPAPAPSSSVALVKVTEENSMTTASVLGGLAGLLVGGVWVGGALFAASSYLARKKDNDVAAALKGVASGSLEALNFSAYVNDKYTVTGKVGDAISKALEKQKAEGGDAVDSITKFTDAVSEAFVSLDKDVGIKDTLGSLATSASEMAAQAVDKAIELNDQYKITDQIKEKIEESTKKA